MHNLAQGKKLVLFPCDLYRYWIGRPDQSVQEDVSKKRYTHHLLIAEKSFGSIRIDEISEPKIKNILSTSFLCYLASRPCLQD
jgi:hypothetical protein